MACPLSQIRLIDLLLLRTSHELRLDILVQHRHGLIHSVEPALVVDILVLPDVVEVTIVAVTVRFSEVSEGVILYLSSIFENLIIVFILLLRWLTVDFIFVE